MGVNWVKRPSPDGVWAGLRGIAFGAGSWVAVGPSVIATSPDGVNWVRRTGMNSYLAGVGYGNGTFLAVGDPGTILNTIAPSLHQRELPSPTPMRKMSGHSWLRLACLGTILLSVGSSATAATLAVTNALVLRLESGSGVTKDVQSLSVAKASHFLA